jgi:hypothetical protein
VQQDQDEYGQEAERTFYESDPADWQPLEGREFMPTIMPACQK